MIQSRETTRTFSYIKTLITEINHKKLKTFAIPNSSKLFPHIKGLELHNLIKNILFSVTPSSYSLPRNMNTLQLTYLILGLAKSALSGLPNSSIKGDYAVPKTISY